jgi:Schwannomin-interacting protein 1
MCPITELVHRTLDKVGMKISPTKRRLSRQLLTNMNIAQLQIIINEFHTFIETLNELLVKYLMDRDDLSMRQDSMLIDIEDITRYL